MITPHSALLIVESCSLSKLLVTLIMELASDYSESFENSLALNQSSHQNQAHVCVTYFSAGLLVINQSFVYHAHLFHFNSAVWWILIKTQTVWSHSVCSCDVAPYLSKKLQWNNRFDQFKTWRCLCGLHKLNCSWWCTFEQWRNMGSLNQRHCSFVLNSWKLHRVWKLCNQNCSSNKGHYMPWLTQKPNK